MGRLGLAVRELPVWDGAALIGGPLLILHGHGFYGV